MESSLLCMNTTILKDTLCRINPPRGRKYDERFRISYNFTMLYDFYFSICQQCSEFPYFLFHEVIPQLPKFQYVVHRIHDGDILFFSWRESFYFVGKLYQSCKIHFRNFFFRDKKNTWEIIFFLSG